MRNGAGGPVRRGRRRVQAIAVNVRAVRLARQHGHALTAAIVRARLVRRRRRPQSRVATTRHDSGRGRRVGSAEQGLAARIAQARWIPAGWCRSERIRRKQGRGGRAQRGRQLNWSQTEREHHQCGAWRVSLCDHQQSGGKAGPYQRVLGAGGVTPALAEEGRTTSTEATGRVRFLAVTIGLRGALTRRAERTEPSAESTSVGSATEDGARGLEELGADRVADEKQALPEVESHEPPSGIVEREEEPEPQTEPEGETP